MEDRFGAYDPRRRGYCPECGAGGTMVETSPGTYTRQVVHEPWCPAADD
jgi:hypothetical protein